MTQVRFVFHGSLQDFLGRSVASHGVVEVRLRDRPAVKHVIESLGIPHPEVARIEWQGRTLHWSDPVPQEGVVHVYPYAPGTSWPYAEPPRFVLDGHLGRLAAYLRLLGFDVLYDPHWDDPQLARLAGQEQRVLLTRDQGLLKRNQVRFGYWVRALEPQEQLREVVRYFDLKRWARPFHRCAKCNAVLEVVGVHRVRHLVPQDVSRRFRRFRWCPRCQQAYWEGSHVARLQRLFQEVLG